MPRSSVSVLCLGLVLLMALTTPAGAASREYQQLMADVRMLQEQVQRQQLAITQLTEALKAATAKLDEHAAESLKVLAAQKAATDTVADGLRVLGEQGKMSNERLGTLATDVAAISRTMPLISTPGAATNQPGGASLPGLPDALGAQPSAILQQAISDYMAGYYDIALAGFQRYVGNDPKSAQAPQAQVYVGDCLLQQRKFDEAIAAFNGVIDNYRGSDKIAEALFKRGRAHEGAGDKARALESYQAVIKQYAPDNEWVLQARQRMAQIKQ